jgi:thioredoxin reductase (NADPH)
MKKFDVLIIGAGAAGLTTGIYTARANLKTGIVEKSAPGGKLVNISQIEN